MTNIDYCKMSIFLNEDEKNFINSKFNNLFHAIYKQVTKSRLEVNIYLGGSVSLREPSLKLANNIPIGINSDADLFVLVKDLADVPKVTQLFKDLEYIEPELERSLHISPLFEIRKNLHLSTIDDLLYSINEPIIETFDAAKYYPLLERHPKTLAMLFAGTICYAILPYYISTNIYSNKNSNIHKLNQRLVMKAVLAGLRLQLYGVVNGAHGINSVYQALPSGVFDNILDQNSIHKILLMRERYQENEIMPEIDKYQFILRAWQHKISIEYSTCAVDTLTSIQNYFFADTQEICDLMAMVIVAFCLYILKPDRDIEKYLEHSVTAVLESGLPISEQLQKSLKQILVILHNSKDPTELTGILVELHHIFLELQTQKIIK